MGEEKERMGTPRTRRASAAVTTHRPDDFECLWSASVVSRQNFLLKNMIVKYVVLLVALLALHLELTSSFGMPGRGMRYRASKLYGRRPTPSREFQAGGKGKGRPAPPPINGNIKLSGSVRVIGQKDDDPTAEDMLGIFSIDEAQDMADEQELDLVLINENGDPPVCKIIDYGKYKYSLEKKKKENAKKQVKSEIKEVKMSYKIDQHDFDVRLRNVQRFLSAGDRVKVIIQFKGREMQHKDLGRELLEKIYKPIENDATLESNPRMEGRSITMLVGPKKT
jgi:translation initiation factor IF-3